MRPAPHRLSLPTQLAVIRGAHCGTVCVAHGVVEARGLRSRGAGDGARIIFFSHAHHETGAASEKDRNAGKRHGKDAKQHPCAERHGDLGLFHCQPSRLLRRCNVFKIPGRIAEVFFEQA